ncbi:MAG: hypothetical protein K6E33_00150 [Lachnospiraceae bacterium]|nr:hypothetical protein [Lachnospiraceae bacterium]
MKELFINKDAVILTLPEIDIENIFSESLVRFILVVVALIAVVVLCYSGYKTISAVIPVLASLFVGWLSIGPACRMTSIRSVQMFVFVLITFMGTMVIFFISVAFGKLIRFLHVRNWLLRYQYIISAILGGILAFIVLYFFVYKLIIPDFIAGFLLMFTGGIVQYRHRFERMTYNSYDDLLKLKTVEERQKEEEEKQRKLEEKQRKKEAKGANKSEDAGTDVTGTADTENKI